MHFQGTTGCTILMGTETVNRDRPILPRCRSETAIASNGKRANGLESTAGITFRSQWQLARPDGEPPRLYVLS